MRACMEPLDRGRPLHLPRFLVCVCGHGRPTTAPSPRCDLVDLWSRSWQGSPAPLDRGTRRLFLRRWPRNHRHPTRVSPAGLRPPAPPRLRACARECTHIYGCVARDALADGSRTEYVYEVRCRASMSVHIDKEYRELASAGDGSPPEEVSAGGSVRAKITRASV